MNTSALTVKRDRTQPSIGETYLKIQLGVKTSAVISTKHVQEALVLPADQLTPMPNMPPCMLGLINRRSRVLWVVDLAQILGLSNPETSSQQNSLVLLQVGSISLALLVKQIEGIAGFAAETIQSPPGYVTSALVPYLRGCILQQQEILLVLDAEAIIQSPILRNH
ncbi:MAG: chemotaxis protein CheW [Leptolyngbyaceae cyanobacterium MO_188.B28]|nr:chemotaxis protein CheW [Leptolyngbyaceae cyanobacterium MO_188.B28]